MMLCYEGLIFVFLEIISNDFWAYALCAIAYVFVPFSPTSMDLFMFSYLANEFCLKVLTTKTLLDI